MLYESAEHIFQHWILVFGVCVHNVDLFCEVDQPSFAFDLHEAPTLQRSPYILQYIIAIGQSLNLPPRSIVLSY